MDDFGSEFPKHDEALSIVEEPEVEASSSGAWRRLRFWGDGDLEDESSIADGKHSDHAVLERCGEQACALVKGCDSYGNEIYNLDGGIAAWKEAGLPVVGSSSGLSIFRQVQIIVGFVVSLMIVLGFLGLTIGFIIAGIFGAALFMAGLTGWCGLAMLLSKMPWNK